MIHLRFLVTFALTVCAFAQDAPLTEEKLISVSSWSKPDERAAALLSIGVPNEVAQHFKDFNASMAGEISWQRLRTSGSVKEAALFLPCLDGSDVAYLFLVGDTVSGWKVKDAYSADCHYKADVSVELVANIIPGRDAILLHNDCDGHGTGYVEHHLHILVPEHGKLREILDTEESVFWSGWGNPGGRHRSLFVPIASINGTTIEETQITQTIDKQTGQPSAAGQNVRRRTWIWSPRKGRMTPTPFRTLNSSSGTNTP